MTPNDVVVLQSLAKQFELIGHVFESKQTMASLAKAGLLRQAYFNMCNYHAQMLRDIAQRNDERVKHD